MEDMRGPGRSDLGQIGDDNADVFRCPGDHLIGGQQLPQFLATVKIWILLFKNK